MKDFDYTIKDGKAIITYSELDEDIGLLPATLGGCPVVAIGKHAFEDNDYVVDVVVPEGVTDIGDYAFYGCSYLTSISLPTTLKSIGDYAFYGCTALESITIPDNVASIGQSAFAGCKNLMSLVLPDGPQTTEEDISFEDEEKKKEETKRIIDQLEAVPTDKIFIRLGESDSFAWEEETIIKFSDYVSGNFVFPDCQLGWQQPEGTGEYEEEELPDGYVLLWDEVNFGNDEYNIAEVKEWFLTNRC